MNNRLKELRIENRWSQNDLAKRTNISPQTVSLIEREKLIPSVLIAINIRLYIVFIANLNH